MSDGTGIEEKVAFLAGTSAFPGAAREVLVRETRTSFVFLTDNRVYKLKKPVRDALIDFTTVASRLANATEEVRLNRRLAPDVYLGVEPLRLLADGTCRVGGAEGEVVDWLVVMRRLPDEGFLDRALARGAVQRPVVESLSDTLARFYLTADRVPVSPSEYVWSLRAQILAARGILLDPRLKLSRSHIRFVTGALLGCAAGRGPVRRRAETVSLVEGHGDLRPEHVWLDGTPRIIDCLEFSRPLRVVDPFDELSFLGLECERLGASWIGRLLIARAKETFGHCPGRPVLAFYRCFRATLRASLALRHFLEPIRRKPGAWHAQARDYLALAGREARVLSELRRE